MCGAAAPQAIEHLLAGVPACRNLPKLPPPLDAAPTERQPYMALMQSFGVQLARIEVRGVWRRGKFTAPSVHRRLFFSCYGCAFSQITDLHQIVRIERSALRSDLDRLALEESRLARKPPFIDHAPRFEGRPVYFWLAFPDRPVNTATPTGLSLPLEAHLFGSPGRPQQQALAAIFDDDSRALACLLRSHPFTSDELSQMLDAAARSGPRAAMIEVLAARGADPNTMVRKGPWRGAMPLVSAAGDPINVAALLDVGADPGSRDSPGDTALDVLRRVPSLRNSPEGKCSAALLEQASARLDKGRAGGKPAPRGAVGARRRTAPAPAAAAEAND